MKAFVIFIAGCVIGALLDNVAHVPYPAVFFVLGFITAIAGVLFA